MKHGTRPQTLSSGLIGQSLFYRTRNRKGTAGRLDYLSLIDTEGFTKTRGAGTGGRQKLPLRSLFGYDVN